MGTNVSVGLRATVQAIQRGGEGFESRADRDDPDGFLARLESCRRFLESQDDRSGVFGSVDNRDVSLLQAFLSREGPRFGGELAPTKDGFEAKFDNLDPGWIWSLRDWIKGLKKHDFPDFDRAPQTIDDSYRIAILSDWATGLYGAPRCAAAIENDPGPIDLVLHLGDVYYAGDDEEVKGRFLKFWPKRAHATNRALNGNHEMYSGGNGYFDFILKDDAFRQRASCFALCNRRWLLVALDTAYLDNDLYGDQAAWVHNLANQYPDQRIVLFSHHQPFSYFEAGGPKIVRKLTDLLTQGRIAAWYWGHEHSCVRYDRHPNWRMYGRCVGHSGFPYFRFLDNGRPNKTDWVRCEAKTSVPGCLVLDGPNPYVANDGPRYGPNGYLKLELRDGEVHEAYYDPERRVVAEFDFTVER